MINETQLGYIGFAYLLCYTIGQFTSVASGRLLGARNLLLVGMAASVVTNVVFGFAANVWTIMAFMAINGFAQATGWPSVVGIMANWTTRAERGTIMGVWATCYQFGGVAATAWAAYWLAQQGWRGSFFAASTVLTSSGSMCMSLFEIDLRMSILSFRIQTRFRRLKRIPPQLPKRTDVSPCDDHGLAGGLLLLL